MTTTQAPPAAAPLPDSQAQLALLAVPVGTEAERFGVSVVRHAGGWSVAGGPPLSLLAATDALMRAAGYRPAPAMLTPPAPNRREP